MKTEVMASLLLSGLLNRRAAILQNTVVFPVFCKIAAQRFSKPVCSYEFLKGLLRAATQRGLPFLVYYRRYNVNSTQEKTQLSPPKVSVIIKQDS